MGLGLRMEGCVRGWGWRGGLGVGGCARAIEQKKECTENATS